MENFEILPTEENLIKTLEADLLGRNQQLSYFYNLLLAQKGASTIAVDGKWGSGKTFFIKQSTMVINAKKPVSIIEKEKREKILSKLFLTESDNYDDCNLAIYYDAWENDNDTDPIVSLVYEIAKQLGMTYTFDPDTDFFKLGGAVLDVFSGKNLKGIIENLKSDNPLSKFKEQKALEEKLKDFFSEALNERGNRLVVFIDELDRCRPDTILDTLEAMKLFMFKGKVAFVIGADERHISYAVKSKFKDIEGIQINIGKEYLEKLIQYPVKIPRLSSDEVETYISCLLLQSELEKDVFDNLVNEIGKARVEDFEKFSLHKVLEKMNIEANESIAVASQVASVLSQGLHGNPRQCKRFLNSMYMRLKMAEFKNKVLDKKILAKIMVLEYIRPQLFNKIANITMDGILQSELAPFENRRDGEEIQGELMIWEKDEWFRDWCAMEPKLSDEDLRLYFYFMRTSLDEKISRISSSLSPAAKDVLDKLMSKSDIKMSEALKISDELTSSEKATILNAMATNMSGQTKIEKEHIESFTKFVIKNKELSVEAFSHCSNFSAKQVPVGGCVYIAELAKKTNMESEYRELAVKWGNIEKNLQQGIENALEME